MAWRIEQHIEAGELDNTIRGRVTGWLKLTTVDEPVLLDLAGNCKPDLAGWKFRIVRTEPVPEWAKEFVYDIVGFATPQTGEVVEITGMTRVRHADCSPEELFYRAKQDEMPPVKWQPAFSIEWWSDRNGPVRASDVRLKAERIGERAFELSDDEYEAEHERIMDESGKLEILNDAVITDLGDGIVQVEFKGDEAEIDDDIREAVEHDLEIIESWRWNDGETWEDDLKEQQREFEQELDSFNTEYDPDAEDDDL